MKTRRAIPVPDGFDYGNGPTDLDAYTRRSTSPDEARQWAASSWARALDAERAFLDSDDGTVG